MQQQKLKKKTLAKKKKRKRGPLVLYVLKKRSRLCDDENEN